jgi:hypothetical protein
MHGLAQRTDVRSGDFGATKQLLRAQRCSCGTILLLSAVASALLSQVLAQQLPATRIDQPHMRGIPLHVNPASDPARRRLPRMKALLASFQKTQSHPRPACQTLPPTRLLIF